MHGITAPDAGMRACSLACWIEPCDGRQRHGVPLFAGELGAYCAAPTPDRLRWFRDVRRGLEQRQIGWALWEWEGCFGLHARHSDAGRLVLDTAVASALGLDLSDKPGGAVTQH